MLYIAISVGRIIVKSTSNISGYMELCRLEVVKYFEIRFTSYSILSSKLSSF